MQTFLPYKNFYKTFKVLDYRRLGKQRVEAFQILNCLRGTSNGKGWKNHPATLMWKGFEDALAVYLNLCIIEWVSRGYKNNMKLEEYNKEQLIFPPWLGLAKLHSSHRAALLYKYPEWYKQWNWKESAEINYFWPTKETNERSSTSL